MAEILLATFTGGVLSVLIAAVASLSFLHRFSERMLAYSVGILLGFALINLLPEAIELGLDPEQAGLGLVGGILVFFILEKLSVWRHHHHHASEARDAPQVMMIVIGDGLHNFVDGVLIAAAFAVDTGLGWATAIAVIAHEIPQELSDFIILLQAGLTRKRALLLNVLSGTATMLGGIVGYLAFDNAEGFLPFILILATSSFLYIAIADLIPELHRKWAFKDGLSQTALFALGIGTVMVMGPHAH